MVKITSFWKKFNKRFAQKKLAVPKYQQEKTEILERFHLIPKPKGPKEVAFLVQCLKKHFVFYSLSDGELYEYFFIFIIRSIEWTFNLRENIVSKMFYCQCEADEYVFKQNDDASSFFIIGTFPPPPHPLIKINFPPPPPPTLFVLWLKSTF